MFEKKYTFLLVDDEAIIREGISDKIDWDKEGFNFLTPCSNGLDAIESIKKNKPHVVLTDICMPGVDGLAVSKFICENFPDTIVFILSGYDDFEYARQALKYNVNEYFLKPISAKTLKGHLTMVREELLKRESFQADYESLLIKAEEHREIIQERFLCRLITRPIDTNEVNRYLPSLPVQSFDNWFNTIVCEIDGEDRGGTNSFNRDVFLLAIQDGCREMLEQRKKSALIFQTPEGRLVIIVEAAQERDCRLESRLLADEIHGKYQSTPGYSLSLGVGGSVKSFNQTGKAYGQSISALEYRLLMGKNSVFFYSPQREVYGSWQFTGYPKIIREALRYKSSDETEPVIVEFFSRLRESGLSAPRIRHEISRVVFSIIGVLENLGLDEERESSLFVEELGRIPLMDDLGEIEINLLGCIARISQNFQNRRQNYPEKKIYEIRKYLDSYFIDRELSSETVAREFNISVSYLGKLFRRYMEKSFLEYVTSLRMTRACELLKQTDGNSQEIAEKCGFNDAAYFASSFKKYTGKTPSQYRASL